MSKKSTNESVLHDWVHGLPFQQQALLLTGMRGPDNSSKHNPAKMIVRYLRGVVIKPAGDWDGKNNNDFMWGEYLRNVKQQHQHQILPDRVDDIFQSYANGFFDDHDEYPHHFIMHLVHCAEVVGYKHPDVVLRASWHRFYLQACYSFHMHPETEEEMDKRLNDFQ